MSILPIHSLIVCFVTATSSIMVMSTPGIQTTTSSSVLESTSPVATNKLSMALFFGFTSVGLALLMVLILLGIAAGCYRLRRKRKYKNEDKKKSDPRSMPTLVVESSPPPAASDPRKHSYSKVNKKRAPNNDNGSPPPPLPPPPRFSNSPTFQNSRPKPQEIVAYDFEISKTFMPYAPPPPVHGLTSNDKHSFTESHNPYNIPMESLADYDEVDTFESSPIHLSPWKPPASSHTMPTTPTTRTRNLSFQSDRDFYFNHKPKKFSLPSEPEAYYDTVDTIHGEVMDLTSSLRSHTANKSASAMIDGHYQSPRRNPAQLSRNNSHCSDAGGINIYTEHLEPSMIHRPSVSSDESEAALPYGPIYATPKTLKRSPKPLEISYGNISEIRSLGVSRFGDVVLAATVDLSLKDLQLGDSNDQTRSFLVAVKKLRLCADWELKSAFQDEIKCMMRMKHANVLRLLGVCSLGVPRFSVVEYMDNGDLHAFLRTLTLVPDDTAHLQDGEATPLILLYMAVQIASGMRFLASRKFIHRDLAARNCLVGREFVVKISEFGMSRSLYDSYYFRIQGQLILPIRWMAYESFYGKFSTKSDVWSFGVTLWEIFSKAEHDPYSEMSDEEVIDNATKGPKRLLLAKPKVCPDDIFDVMKRCWVHEPSMRADFEEIYSRLFLTYISKSQQASY